ncbi:MAG: helix-turn-helix domain-containing protein [Acidocella sp.]|nr:helix-turn-helix domain-containing protein [Acidocella sp.]
MAVTITPAAFNIQDAARYCGIKPARLRRLAKSGTAPPPVKLGQRAQVWLRDALDEWLAGAAGKHAPSGLKNEWLEE